MRLFKLLGSLSIGVVLGGCVFATNNSFTGDIQVTGPYKAINALFSDHGCTSCHASLAGHDSDASWLTDTEWGPRITPGDSAHSILYEALNGGANGTTLMPPSGSSATPFSADDLAKLAAWIDGLKPLSE